MRKRYLVIICFALSAGYAHAQTPVQDTIAVSNDMAIDTSIDYDDLFNEFDLFLDSILTPRSYFLANLTIGQGYFNFTNKNNTQINVVPKYTFSPTLGYYGKKGFGFTMAGNMVRTEGKFNLYQVSLSPSVDYLQNRNMALGFAYMRYITKDSLPFYVSPLQNEINGYFLWRKSWLQPGIAASYGWGSRTEYKKRLRFIEELQRRVLIGTVTQESIADFSLTASVKHDFYWLTVLSKKDYIKLTPQLAFSSGTQKFGFNQATGTYGLKRFNILFSSGNVNLDDKMKFQPISLTLYLRTEYSLGKFFIQPQVLFDYYFPAKEENFTTLFSLNTGFMF